jgi:HTH-type transcriptional regulator / antitoxin HigA
MNNIKPIRTEADYQAALARIDELMEAELGTQEGEELDVLADLVEHYESKHVPMGYPNAIAAIEFRMEQAGLTQRDLVPFLGSRAKVSEVLSGKRRLTLPMAKALNEHLGIPSDALLKGSHAASKEASVRFEWERFPLREMIKRKWIPKVRNPEAHAEELIRGLIRRAGIKEANCSALYRKNDHARTNAKTDPCALKAWCLQVLAQANEKRPRTRYKRRTITPKFLSEIARLSRFEDGPRRAEEFLRKHGIVLVYVPHLPRTYLDGAALRLGDGTPVVGLTLRYDRIDNFWFCLLHELAHLGRHMDNDDEIAFVDDHTLRATEGGSEDLKEAEADEWAEEALIPPAIWETSTIRHNPTPMGVMSLASSLQIHPAIVAGRIRYDQRNYRLLSQFVGTGEVRRLFNDEVE